MLDILPNGSGFLRADPYLRSRDDAYVSAAQIRRCELRAGDELAGPVRPPRRSERHYSLIRIESVNGAPAEPPRERPLFEEMTPVHPTERLAAPDELTHVPFGRGSRVMVFGPPGAGATTLLRRIAATLSASYPDLPMTVVLAGAKPEEIPEWRAESQAEVVGGSFDESQRGQAEVAAMAIERAKRAAERGQDAVVVVDSLSGLPSEVARRILGAARKLEGVGSVTVIAAVGEAPDLERLATTRIVLERGARPGAPPRLHEAESGTLRAELLS
jgi:transcription termination factor Rho